MKNSLPASVDLIIHSEDASSALLASKIHEFISAKVKNAVVAPVKFSELNQIQSQENISTVLVVSGCVSNGNRLNSLSRVLRAFKNSSIHYFIGILRTPLPVLTKILLGNLEFRQESNETNKVHALYDIHLPNHHSKRFRRYEKSPWHQEVVFLELILSSGAADIPFLNQRLDEISSITGLRDNLFYPSPFSNSPLVLRENFAYYKFGAFSPTQADIYFIFSSVFHCLRHPLLISSPKSDDIVLMQHEHVRTILQPENFIRFNDGIIQACILRLATPAELDYSIDELASAKMLSVLKSILSKEDLDASEAIIEFLLALATGKMKLVKSHSSDLFLYLKNEFIGWPIIDLFLQEVERKVS